MTHKILKILCKNSRKQQRNNHYGPEGVRYNLQGLSHLIFLQKCRMMFCVSKLFNFLTYVVLVIRLFEQVYLHGIKEDFTQIF